MTKGNHKLHVLFLLSVVAGSSLTTSLALKPIQVVEARPEEVVDTANNNLKISFQAPDDWNSGKLSATVLSIDWKLNGLFATNFATKLFGGSDESIALFAIVNAPSLANAAIPLVQKLGLISFALSQFVTINQESDMTLSDGSNAHLYSISASIEQLRKLKAPIDKPLDAVLISTQQQDKTYLVVYATELGRISQYQNIFDNMLNSLSIGTVSFSGAGNPSSSTTTNNVQPPSSSNVNPNPIESTPPSPSQTIEPSIKSDTLFSAELNGGDEVPPVDTKATGETTFRIAADDSTIKYKVDVTGFSDATGAHIHMGRAGANGDVIVDLLRDSMNNPSTLGMVISGIITDSSLVGPMKGKTVADLISAMSNGDTYTNVHTQEHQKGEIRGQIRIR